VTEYEVTIPPRHTELQKKFETFLKGAGVTELKPNVSSVDLRYRDQTRQNVLSEIKPCDLKNARYAIRTAMGQLLDYAQRCAQESRLLIVLETVPKKDDAALALTNGFGLAYPEQNTFQMVWPEAT